MRTFRVCCVTCDRRLGLGEEWIPAHRDGAFECTRCAGQRTSHPAPLASALMPPGHVRASLRAPQR